MLLYCLLYYILVVLVSRDSEALLSEARHLLPHPMPSHLLLVLLLLLVVLVRSQVLLFPLDFARVFDLATCLPAHGGPMQTAGSQQGK